MVISNTTTEIINYTKDIDIEYNSKIILLLIVTIYALAMIYFSNKLEFDGLWFKFIKTYVMKVPSFIFLFFMPLLVFFLNRGITFETLYLWLLTAYGILMTILFISFKFGLFEFGLKLLGIKYVSKMEMKQIKL